MNAQPDVKSLNERVERLEKQNRWMKRMGAVAILFVVVMFVSGQAKVDTKKTVEANEFVVRDSNGNVRARLGMGAAMLMRDGPGLALLDEHGSQMVRIASNGSKSEITVNSATAVTSSSMWAGLPGEYGSDLAANGPAGVVRINLNGSIINGPQIALLDKEGYETHIGKTDLVFTKSGTTEQTSAASVVMFDKANKVLWSAP